MLAQGPAPAGIIMKRPKLCYPLRMPSSVDARARRHFAAIGQALDGANRERMRSVTPEGAAARIIEGLEMGRAFPLDAASRDALERRTLEKAELHCRWRQLHNKP